jgi:signal transduction histidine kinase
MALPLMIGEKVLGAVTIQSTHERAFSADDIITLQTMANYLAIAIHNAGLLQELEQTHTELVRTKMFEAIATTTGEAIHWVGNKATPIAGSVRRVRDDMFQLLTLVGELIDQPPESREQHPFWPVIQSVFEAMARQGIDLPSRASELTSVGSKQLSQLIDLESILEDLDIIEHSADSILAIKEDLIGPMRVQQKTSIPLPDMLNGTVQGMGLPDGVVQTHFSDNLPAIYGDKRQLERVFINLIKNAWEALEGHPDPQIRIVAQQVDDPDFVMIQVRDNGSGIPLEMLDKIWVSFFTTKGDQGGTGLGLSACTEIISQNDGKIWLESSQEGVGTTFVVLLPVAK